MIVDIFSCKSFTIFEFHNKQTFSFYRFIYWVEHNTLHFSFIFLPLSILTSPNYHFVIPDIFFFYISLLFLYSERYVYWFTLSSFQNMWYCFVCHLHKISISYILQILNSIIEWNFTDRAPEISDIIAFFLYFCL